MVVVLPALLALAIAAENANDAGDKTNVGNFKLPEDAKWLDHMLLTFLQDPWAYATYSTLRCSPSYPSVLACGHAQDGTGSKGSHRPRQ